MNTNNLNTEIEMLKEESAPAHLKARIVKGILDDKKSKNMITKKIIGFGLPAILVGAIALGAIMTPKTALADPIAQTRDAFEAARNYHMTTYQVVEGQRKRISESWVENGKRTTYMVGEDGILTQLDDILFEVQGTVSGTIFELEPAQVAQGKEVQTELHEIIVIGGGPDKNAPHEKIEITDPGQTLVLTGHNLIELEGTGEHEGEVYTIELMPFVDAEMSIEALQKLLLDTDLWNIEPNQMVNGQLAHKYKLKESYMDFTVYVDPQTKLPILTRQTLHDADGKNKTTTEVEYDYTGSVPPTTAQKPTEDTKK